MSSSPESPNPVLRGTDAEALTAAQFGVDLRHGRPEMVNHEAVERARQEARTTGYAEGWAQGQREAAAAADDAAARARAAEEAHEQRRAAALARSVNALGRAVTELENQLMPTFTELQEVLLAHAFELAEAIVGRSLDDPNRRGADALRRAMAAAPDSGALVVSLCPADFQTLVGPEGQTEFDYEGRKVTLRQDPALQPGDALAETGTTTVDATISGAVARAREALRL